VRRSILFIVFAVALLQDIFSVNLIDVYKKGVIKLVEDPEFGKGVDWIELFYDLGKDLAIAPDGRIFVTNANQHNVFIFSKEGRYIKTFGQYGLGPLDFFAPSDPSILDKKYLVINDYQLNQKITLVDLDNIDSHHAKVLKTKKYVWNFIALRDNKIAYLTWKFEPISKWDQKRTHELYIIDAVTRKETKIASFEYRYNCRSDRIQYSISSRVNYFWSVFIERTKEGDLLVGVSDRPNIDIYSPEGKKIRSFNLDYKPIKVTDELKEDFIKFVKSRAGWNTPLGKRSTEDFFNALPGAQLFGDHFPYYRHILVDYSGNILVFPNTLCREKCEILFRVYSPEGKYICTTKVNTGKFKFELDLRFKQILFTEDGIYGLFDLKGAEDIMLRLVRVKLEDAMK